MFHGPPSHNFLEKNPIPHLRLGCICVFRAKIKIYLFLGNLNFLITNKMNGRGEIASIDYTR